MAKTISITLTDEQTTALNGSLDAINAQIDAKNKKIAADKEYQASLGNEYIGPEPSPMLTFDQLVQQRFNERVQQDVQVRMRAVSEKLAATFMAADPQTQAQMLADMAKYNQPPVAPAEPQPPARSRRRR